MSVQRFEPTDSMSMDELHTELDAVCNAQELAPTNKRHRLRRNALINEIIVRTVVNKENVK